MNKNKIPIFQHLVCCAVLMLDAVDYVNCVTAEQSSYIPCQSTAGSKYKDLTVMDI